MLSVMQSPQPKAIIETYSQHKNEPNYEQYMANQKTLKNEEPQKNIGDKQYSNNLGF